MKISTKGRYGLRLMFELAYHYNKGLVPLKEIAKRQEISDKYLEQIIMRLNHAGLVKSVRGAQGGYMLAAPPEETTVEEVLPVLEGSLCVVECIGANGVECKNINSCPTYGIWSKINQAIQQVVSNITLADMVEDYLQNGSSDYVI